MAKILITAFESYGPWKANASWLALVELTRQLPAQHSVTTRLYPVDLAVVERKLEEDLAAQFDLALHLGQAPGSTHVQFEAIGINVTRDPDAPTAAGRALVTGGPVAFDSRYSGLLFVSELPSSTDSASVTVTLGNTRPSGVVRVW